MHPAFGLMLQLVLLSVLAAVVLVLKGLALWRQLQASEQPQERPQMADPLPDMTQVDTTLLEGAGMALAHPPTDLGVTLSYISERYAHRRFTLPLGWQAGNGAAVCVVAHLVDDVYHVLVTAKSRAGKDNAVLTWLLTLALLNPPERLQVAIVDGKGGLDWAGWRGTLHTWLLAIDTESIAPAMAALTRERERRAVILRTAGVSSWEGYKGSDLPLLVISISELLLLQDATSPKELERWLNSELSASGAFGMRYIVATQTASNFSTRWRGQVDLFVAGFQPSASQDQPNTGLSSGEIKAAGGVPPSELPGLPLSRGVFTLVQGRQIETVRVGYLDDTQRRRWLAQLPAASLVPPATSLAAPRSTTAASAPAQALPPVDPAPAADVIGTGGGFSAVSIDPNELAAAQALGRLLAKPLTPATPTEMTDDEIKVLLAAKTPVRHIAARLRGRMQKRLKRIAAIRALMTSK